LLVLSSQDGRQQKAFFDLAHTWAWAALPPEAPWIRQDGAQAASVDGFVLRRIKKRPLGVASLIQATKPNLPSVAGGGQARKYYRPLEHACTRTTRRVRSVLNVDDVRLKFRWRKGKGSGTKVSTHQLGGVSTGDRGNRYASEKIGADEGDRIFVIS